MKIKNILFAIFFSLTCFLLAGCERSPIDMVPPGEIPNRTSADAPEIAQRGGEWVVITRGVNKGGEPAASSWYLLRFYEDSTVKILWTMPHHYARERAKYSQKGNTITISGAAEAPQLNGTLITLGANNTMVASIPGTGGGDNLSFTHRTVWWPYLHWFLLFSSLAVVYYAWRQWKWFTPIIVGVGVVALSIYWANTLDAMPIFRWVKNYTLVVTIWLFWAARFTPLTEYKWGRFLCAAILAINILEATEVDLRTAYLPNYLNAAAGILNILAITRWMGIGPNRTPTKDLIWSGQTKIWIIAYDFWNISVSYLNYHEYTSNSIALNVMATILAMAIPGTWVSTRGVTLGLFYLYFFTCNFFVQTSFVPIPINETSALLFGLASFTVNLVLCAYVWRWKIFKKAPILPSFGQYRHAYHTMIGIHDSIHVDKDKIPALADYPPKAKIILDTDETKRSTPSDA